MSEELGPWVTAQRGVLIAITNGLQAGRLVLSPLNVPNAAAQTRTGNKQAHTKEKERANELSRRNREITHAGHI